ncbi:hypothetical protein J007_05493 [Cryptococcus neoformans]|nr:hypothetical protein C356_05557 [Cryptococcus neoformans var. grubii c45]OXB34820.1 hypothetical protein J007_05493 [Cryptococcus neoformans var. grubii]OXC58943.1 hypothetical protein C358_05611 [Cryptococcus neoformans var. grubii MW-RSA852]
MPLLKRKPVHLTPLPSLSAVLQPIPTSSSISDPLQTQAPTPLTHEQLQQFIPPDGKDDAEQLEKLLAVFRGEFTNGQTTVVGKKSKGKAVAPSSSIVNGESPQDGEPSATVQEEPAVAWRIHDRDCWYIPETGEIFTDYESYSARKAFYDQQIFQCEVSGKSSMPYLDALRSEQKEIRQLHTRFPKQLKKAVLSAVQFQIEGKLENLADKIFERFHNRFFDDEKVFVDVQGDKYLARVIKTVPPSPSLTLVPSTSNGLTLETHPLAIDLNLPSEEVLEKDDPGQYIYIVKLVEDDVEDDGQENALQITADRISRDRINFSRAMLKRFIRDCVERDAAVYSPWIVKPAVARRWGIPMEMSESTKLFISSYRERQMGKRKREREERLGLNVEDEEVEEKPKTKKQMKEEEKRMKEEEKAKKKEEERRMKEEEEERKKKKQMKWPNEDLLVEWSEEDVRVRPQLVRTLPFGDQFEKLLNSWSFLNVMGTPLNLSPFTIDEFEQSLYHTTSPSPPLIAEIHACLLSVLIADAASGHSPVRPISATGRQPEDDRDYWEGEKGATTETLSPVAEKLAQSWKDTEIPLRDNRRGWEAALIGCLWERASLESLPNFLDNILHLTFEPKPAPTRPTWSTGPSSSTSSSGLGLVPAKIPTRYPTLHHLHKLDIIAFLIELVGQTEKVRGFMEESIAALTEVRKEQVDVKREIRRVQAEREGLEPKTEDVEAVEGEAGMDVDMDVKVNGHVNGGGEGEDELEDDLDTDMRPPEDDTYSALSSSPSADQGHHAQTAASRRRAMAEKARERAAEEAMHRERAIKEREEARLSKYNASEKKRLFEEEEVLAAKLKKLDYEFRSHIWTLRSKPLGLDRFGNRVWWLDAQGSAPMLAPDGKLMYGTGRLYIQGVDEPEETYYLNAANAVLEGMGVKEEVKREDVERRRKMEEGGKLGRGEWGCYDDVEQVREFMRWLNPKGIREKDLLKALTFWQPELLGGITKRRQVMGLDVQSENEEPTRRTRPTRRAAGDDEEKGYMGWRNRRAGGKE